MDKVSAVDTEEKSSLADTGNSLSRQMASMYRTLKQVKDDEEGERGDDEDTYTDEQESEPEVDTTSAHRSFDALDTEDDVNKMSDLDSESCSFAGRQNRNALKESGLAKSPKRLNVCDNINELDDDKTPQPKEGYHFTYPDSSVQASDPHITPMSLTLTSTDNGNHEGHNQQPHEHHDHHGHHHHGNDHENHNDSSGSESDDESLPDTSSDECSRCLCCSSLASYQNIPWRIQRRDSATTTEASDSSEYCSDSDEEEGHRRVPLYAKFSPFFFQECASGEEGDAETDECEKMDEDADSLPEQTRMSPLGRESSPARPSQIEDNTQKSKEADQPAALVKHGKEQGKPSSQTTESEPTEEPKEEEADEQSSASVIDKIKRMQTRIQDEKKDVEKQLKTKKKPESKSKFLSPDHNIHPPVKDNEDANIKKAKVPPPEVSEKHRHVSKSHMFVVAPPQLGEHKGTKKMVLTTGDEPMFEIPASCIDKEGKVTLRPDPKLAPEAYKSGKTITFQVKHTPDGIVATDGPMMLTTNPRTTRTVLRVRSSQPSTPTTPTNTRSTVEVTPEGVINIRKRRTVPVKINPVQAIPVVEPSQEDPHSCTHCNHHRQVTPSTHHEAVPRYVTRKVTTRQTTVTPVYGNSAGQPIIINQQGATTQPQQQYVINTQQGGVIPQSQSQSIVINPHGGFQQRQIIVGPQPVRTGPIQSISVTPSSSSVQQGSPVIYRTNSGEPVQSFQMSPGQMQQPFQMSPGQMQQPRIRLGMPPQGMSVRVSDNGGYTVPVQGTQPGQMHFVINQ
ncbi:uncharacterized protein [Apostichopus japonicus]|uniref:uncharacterized protein isoform X2 n=1 Tax=Stichopus japonicus TaxID=307972 RepID=UPI003AB53FAA